MDSRATETDSRDGDEAPADATPGDQRRPSRLQRWGVRLGIVLGVVVGIALMVRVWWGLYTEEILQEEVDAILARGEPLEWKDFAAKPVADAENAVVYYRKALQSPLLRAEPPPPNPRRMRAMPPLVSVEEDRPTRLWRLRGQLDRLASDPPYRRKHRRDVQEILTASADALSACRRARACRRADWGVDHTQSAVMSSTMDTIGSLDLAELLALAALEAQAAGRDGEAFEYLRDGLALGRVLRSMPQLMGHSFGLHADGKIAQALEQMAPKLRIGSAPAATPEQVVALQSQLLDDRPVVESHRRAVFLTRSMLYDTWERVRDGRMPLTDVKLDSELAFLLKWVVRPAWALDEARGLRYLSGCAAAAEHARYPAGRDALPELEELTGIRKKITPSLTRMFAGLLTLDWEGRWEVLADRRMAAVALAIRQHQLDHGRRPQRLADLRPAYLSSIPADPFSGQARAIGYATQGRYPVLYSVSLDGRDNGGAFDVYRDGSAKRDRPDRVFFLNGDRPRGRAESPFMLPPGVGGPAVEPAPPDVPLPMPPGP